VTAVVALRRALSLRSSDANTHYNLAAALMNTDERGAAPRHFAQAAARRARPTTLRAYFDPHGH